MAFSNEQLERYSRHIILKEVGAKGQKKLLNAKVLIIGAGGLGAPVAMYLAAAGVGTIGIADADEVDQHAVQGVDGGIDVVQQGSVPVPDDIGRHGASIANLAWSRQWEWRWGRGRRRSTTRAMAPSPVRLQAVPMPSSAR